YFGHDASHKRTRNVAQIMDIIQKINLLIIERLKTNMKSSIPRIQKKLARMKPQQLITIQF
ncbi:ISAs1 family transposase, partial [Porphyromonas gingivalis]|nr:ISAs1 family transposase [Porphyromonas gingivalis]